MPALPIDTGREAWKASPNRRIIRLFRKARGATLAFRRSSHRHPIASGHSSRLRRSIVAAACGIAEVAREDSLRKRNSLIRKAFYSF